MDLLGLAWCQLLLDMQLSVHGCIPMKNSVLLLIELHATQDASAVIGELNQLSSDSTYGGWNLFTAEDDNGFSSQLPLSSPDLEGPRTH